MCEVQISAETSVLILVDRLLPVAGIPEISWSVRKLALTPLFPSEKMIHDLIIMGLDWIIAQPIQFEMYCLYFFGEFF